MAASRSRATGTCARFFGVGVFLTAFLTASLPATMGRRVVAAPTPPALQRLRVHLIASPFGTIEPATYSYARPIGTAMPRPPGYLLASFEAASGDASVWPADDPSAAAAATEVTYPAVDRRLKGDRLPLHKRTHGSAERQSGPHAPAIATPAKAAGTASGVAKASEGHAPSSAAVLAAGREAADVPPEVPASGSLAVHGGPHSPRAAAGDTSSNRDASIYFAAPGSAGSLKPWTPGAAPIRVTDSAESGIKVSALEGKTSDGRGVTVARKDDAKRLETPAQRLKLHGKARARARKCLAQAVYFEARGEPYRGQEAVAQVVMNRVFSGYYPRSVCGVVFQNADHYEACQFTFACEHKNLNRIDEPKMWAQAERIANNTLDGKFWLADIGHATHYHAYWVHPRWVHEMKRLDKLGGHTFYRPRAWGSGDNEPVWGPAQQASQADPKSDAAAKGPEAEAAPSPSAGTGEATAKL